MLQGRGAEGMIGRIEVLYVCNLVVCWRLNCLFFLFFIFVMQQTSTLVRTLKNMLTSGYAHEYDVGGFTDPFLQIRLLRLLHVVGHNDANASDVMSDVLAQVRFLLLCVLLCFSLD